MMKKNPKKKTLKFDVLNYNCNLSPNLNTSSLILMSDGSYTSSKIKVYSMFTIKQRNWSIMCFLCDYLLHEK